MTRAEQRLFLTSAMSRRLYNSDSYNLPSRFLDELPEKLVERWNGGGKSREPRAGGYGWGITSREPRAESREPSQKAGGLRYRVRRSRLGPLQVGRRVRHPEWASDDQGANRGGRET